MYYSVFLWPVSTRSGLPAACVAVRGWEQAGPGAAAGYGLCLLTLLHKWTGQVSSKQAANV